MHTIELVGWISGIIAALFTLLPVSVSELNQWGYIPIVSAIAILSFTAMWSRRIRGKSQNQDITEYVSDRSKPKRRLISTTESKLDDLIQELDFFIEKWRKSTFGKVCYRKDIEAKAMWQNRGKIREHSREIRKKTKPLRRLQGFKPTLDSLEDIVDKMVDFGLEVESTFETTKTINEALQTEPNRINRLMSEGDRICEDLTNIVSQFEKLR